MRSLESYQRGGPCDSFVHMIGLGNNTLDISIVKDISNHVLDMCFTQARDYTVQFVIYP